MNLPGLRILLAPVVLAAACGGEDSPDLFVDVRTDVRPGHEFEVVRVELVGAGSLGSGRVEQAATADQQTAYLEGIRVAEFEDVDRSRAALRVSLLDDRGLPMSERTASVRLGSSDRVVTIVLTRDCADVSCPGSGDDASLVACLGGRCVDPRCTPQSPEHCPRGCTEDSECAVEAPCATGRCDHGTCFRVEMEGACGAGSWCHPEMGCMPIPVDMDGAVRADGSADATMPLDGRMDGTAPSDGGMDAPPELDGSAEGDGCTGDCLSATCGDGACNGSESPCSCAADCGATTCGDGCCGGSEDSASCAPDCGAVCGDGACNGSENACGCAMDCGAGSCGDGICCASDAEDPCSCAMDCGSSCGSGVTLAAAGRTTCALSAGALYCWGANSEGQLGLGDTMDRATPTRVGGADDWVQILAGGNNTCGVRSDGTVWCWGDNLEGQLGQGDTTDRTSPTQVAFPPMFSGGVDLLRAAGHACMTDDDGSVWCWGWNSEGQLGQGDTTNRLEPTPVPVGTGCSAFATGFGHSLAVVGGGLYAWGGNHVDQLGLGSGSPIQVRNPTVVPTGGPFFYVAAGQHCSCAIGMDGNLSCWGANGAAQLGAGDRTDRDVPTVVDTSGDWLRVDINAFHACGIRAPGSLWCWGRGTEGQLGQGGFDDMLVPTRVGSADNWVEVAVGRFHTCAKRSDGTVWCMGDNDSYELGTGDLTFRDVPTQIAFP